MDRYTKTTRYAPYANTKKSKPENPYGLTNSQLTKVVLNTLKDPDNPISNPDPNQRREDHYVSFSTGHQVNDGPGKRKSYFDYRNGKLAFQRAETAMSHVASSNLPGGDGEYLTTILQGTKIYLNGYLGDQTTDYDMKRIVTIHGGTILMSPAGATHIVTAMPLCGSKTHKILTKKSKVMVVKPEWVFESIEKAKRQPERLYAVLPNEGNKKLADMWT